MKAQVINTTFLHDGIYYYPNSIVNVPPELIKKYPRILLPVDLFPEETNGNPSLRDLSLREEIKSSEMIWESIPTEQDSSNANNIHVPSGIVEPKVSNKNKRGKK